VFTRLLHDKGWGGDANGGEREERLCPYALSNILLDLESNN